MWDDAALRAIYRRGVLDALDTVAIHLSPGHARAVAQWVVDLENWDEGPAPPAPHLWAPDGDRPG
jgi:hypothetical protein